MKTDPTQVQVLDFAQAIREGTANAYVLHLQKHFGGVDTLVRVHEEWPIAEGNNARFHLEDFVKEEGYKLQFFNYHTEGEVFPCKFSDVEYSPNKYKNCLEDGKFFLSKGKQSFLMHSSMSKYDRVYELGITCPREHMEEAQQLIRKFRKYIEVHNIYKGARFKGDLSFVKQDKEYTWDDLVVDDATRQQIQRNLLTVLQNRQLHSKFSISTKRGIILSGEPGTGKTMLGKILCSTMKDWSFLWVSPGDLGRIENLKGYCHLAKTISPTILFLEDLDLHFQSRDSNAENSLLGELMNQLDGIDDVSNVVVVATTNRPGQLEDALAKRPGRFDKVIHFGKPDSKTLQVMFERFGEGKLAEINWEKLLRSAEGSTGAQVKEIITQAILSRLDSASFDEKEEFKLTTSELVAAARTCKGKDFTSAVGFAVPNDEAPSFRSPAWD